MTSKRYFFSSSKDPKEMAKLYSTILTEMGEKKASCHLRRNCRAGKTADHSAELLHQQCGFGHLMMMSVVCSYRDWPRRLQMGRISHKRRSSAISDISASFKAILSHTKHYINPSHSEFTHSTFHMSYCLTSILFLMLLKDISLSL